MCGMPLKDKEKQKEYKRQYHLKNKEKILQQQREYRKTEKGKKLRVIGGWKRQGILCFDYNLLYDIFLLTNNCEYCNCELNKCSKSIKCLDHDHNITDKFNIRGVLCRKCNSADVLIEPA